MSLQHTHEPGQLVQKTGSYRAWRLDLKGGPVDLAWHCRVDHTTPEMHRLLPFCEPSLVIRRRFDPLGRTLECSLLITPAEHNGGRYAPVPGEEQFALRLAPELMARSLGVCATDYLEENTFLPQQWNGAFDAALTAADRGDMRGAIKGLLHTVARLSSERGPDRVAHAARLLRGNPGRVTMGCLAEQAGVTSRHLRREFVRRLGLPPRGLARRLRLAAALIEADGSLRPDWAGIAAGNGFSDQAHMIRECRAIMGETPGELFQVRREMSVSFNT